MGFEFVTILGIAWQLVSTYGISVAGWICSIFLVWHIFRKKNEKHKEIEQAYKELGETKDEYILKVQEMNEQLANLNAKHAEVVNSISEKRVEDLKELTDDYNKLATNTLRALDRFVVAIEISNGNGKRAKQVLRGPEDE